MWGRVIVLPGNVSSSSLRRIDWQVEAAKFVADCDLACVLVHSSVIKNCIIALSNTGRPCKNGGFVQFWERGGTFVSFNEVPAKLAAFNNFIEDTAIAMRPSPSSNSWSLAYGSTCFPSSSRASALSIDECQAATRGKKVRVESI